MTPQILLVMWKFLDMTKPLDITCWCVFVFMFFLMARKSNMVPVSLADFGQSKQLLRQDVKSFKVMVLIQIMCNIVN